MLWREREDTVILNYDRKFKNAVHLTVVHMCNKMYNFPLVVVKDGVSTEYQIDDLRNEMLSSILD